MAVTERDLLSGIDIALRSALSRETGDPEHDYTTCQQPTCVMGRAALARIPILAERLEKAERLAEAVQPLLVFKGTFNEFHSCDVADRVVEKLRQQNARSVVIPEGK